MKADYDRQANALGIELVEVDRWDDGDGFDEDYCNLGFSKVASSISASYIQATTSTY